MKALPEINPLFDGVEVDERILKYYYNNHVRQFVYDRPTYRGPADKDNEFKVKIFVTFTTEYESLLLQALNVWQQYFYQNRYFKEAC